jgi:hypothetical protein
MCDYGALELALTREGAGAADSSAAVQRLAHDFSRLFSMEYFLSASRTLIFFFSERSSVGHNCKQSEEKKKMEPRIKTLAGVSIATSLTAATLDHFSCPSTVPDSLETCPTRNEQGRT